MWSHYADSYKGVVIGVDTVKAGFHNQEQYIIPAQKGELRYIDTLPKNVNESSVKRLISIGDSQLLNWENDEDMLKHGLLYKMREWGCEEEVRIVKNISSVQIGIHSSAKNSFEVDNQKWNRIRLSTRSIYTTRIPKEAFVDVTIGLNAYKELRRLQEFETGKFDTHEIEKFNDLTELCMKLELPLFSLDRDFQNWGLNRRLIK